MSQARNPLYLLVMLNELRALGGNDMNRVVPALIARMSQDYPDTVSLFLWVVERLEVFGAEEVRWWCSYLANSRVGMASQELADLLSRKLGPHATANALRIQRAIRSYLLRRGQRLDYCHTELKRAVEQRFLSRESHFRQSHRDMAQYFYSLGMSSQRMLAETPYHQYRAQMWDGFTATLCSIDFIGAKARSGMIDGLLADYQVFERSGSGSESENEREVRIGEYVNQLIAHDQHPEQVPLPSPPPSVRFDAHSQPENIEIGDPEQALSGDIQAWSHFVSHHTLALAQGVVPGFQLAYNSASSGPVHEAMKRRITGAQLPNGPWIRLVNRPASCGLPACVRTLEGHTGDVLAVAITPDGRLGVSGCSHGAFRVWDLKAGICLHANREHQGVPNTIAITPDGRLAAAGHHVGSQHYDSICVWSVATGQIVRTLHPGVAMILRLGADGRHLVTRSGGRVVRTYDLSAGGQCVAIRDEPGALASSRMTPDGQCAVLEDPHEKGTLLVLDVLSCKCKRLRGHKDGASAATITHDGALIVSGGSDGTLRLWDAQSGICLQVLRGHTGSVSAVSVTPDGRWILSGSHDKTVRLWDATRCIYNTTQCSEELPRRLGGSNHVGEPSLGISADGRRAIFAAKRNTAQIWDVSEGRCLQVLRGHTADVSSVAITADGKSAITGSTDMTVRTWNAANGECRHVFRGQSGRIFAVAASRDGSRIFSWSEARGLKSWAVTGFGALTDSAGLVLSSDSRFELRLSGNEVILWDLSALRPVKSLKEYAAQLGGGAASLGSLPDGTVISSRTQPARDTHIWNPFTGTIHKTLAVAHWSFLRMFYVIPDGRRAIFVGFDEKLRVYNLRTGQCGLLLGHGYEMNGGIRNVAVAADGRLAVSASFDKTVRVWDLWTNRCLAVHLAPGGAVNWVSVGLPGIVVDTARGIEFLQLENMPFGPLILTLSRLWLFGPDGQSGQWDASLSATCPACGRRIEASPPVVDVIHQILRNCRVTPDQSACLELPDEAWEEPGLLAECPHCHRPVKYNPFTVDNSHYDLREGAGYSQGAAHVFGHQTPTRPPATAAATRTNKARHLLFILGALVVIAICITCSMIFSWLWVVGIPLGLYALITCLANMLVLAGHLAFVACPRCGNVCVVWQGRRCLCRCSFRQ